MCLMQNETFFIKIIWGVLKKIERCGSHRLHRLTQMFSTLSLTYTMLFLEMVVVLLIDNQKMMGCRMVVESPQYDEGVRGLETDSRS
jgi:hypothetical protein